MKRCLIVLCLLAVLLVPCVVAQEPSPESKIPLRILYAGMPDTARQQDFVSFLGRYFAEVKTVDVGSFKATQAENSDVVILDKDGIQWGDRGEHPLFELRLGGDYNRATLALGIPGAFLYDRMNLKPGYR